MFLEIYIVFYQNMKLSFIVIFCSLMVLATRPENNLRTTEIAWSGENAPDENENTQIIRSAKLDFSGTLKRSFALYAFLANPEKSIICSPISALLPLGKLILGSERGHSRNELLTAIGVPKHKIKHHFQSLIQRLEYLPGVELSIASKIFVSHLSQVSVKYQRLTESVFKSSITKMDFSSPIHSSTNINKWVSDQTKGMIKEIVSPSDIKPGTSLVLVNAIYFAGMWKQPFRKVTVGNFYSPSGVRQLPMMSHETSYNYATSHTLGSEIIEIPYVGEKASFVIVLPEAKSGLTLLLQQLKLAPDLLNHAMEDMRPKRLRLTIPKFKVQSELNLKTLYNKIGVNHIFSSKKAKLMRIVRGDGVYVSRAIQKCVIEVFEKGTEASSVSVDPSFMHLKH